MKKRHILTFLSLFLVCILTLVIMTGCKGSDSREKVDEVVEEMTGKKNIDRMEEMKKNIHQTEELQKKRYDQLKDPEEE